MADLFDAVANPEKRLFISLVTRDISLADAIVDLTDNSVNAAMQPLKNAFSTSGDFHKLLSKEGSGSIVSIKVQYDTDSVTVSDDAHGIDFESARTDVFRFGHSSEHESSRDRLSVYGIGLKRALFKIGNKISITSDHKRGGFALNLDVPTWEADKSVPWTFPISKRPSSAKTGTKIVITRLHKEIQKRFASGQFQHELLEKLSKVYSYYLGRVVNISVNGKAVGKTEFQIGDNFSNDKFKVSEVDCTITAGISNPTGNKFLAEASGWFVFCNFRTVLYADKSPLTGWGGALPIFQPKHRPFLGMVSFVSSDPEALPWTTTKSGINVDNIAWQEATLRMAAVAKPIIRLLDTRYTADGTDVPPSDLVALAGKAENVFDATVSRIRTFTPAVRNVPKTQRVQYDAKISELEAIRKHYSRSGMSASEIGRRTFDYFLKNVSDGK